MAIQIGAFRQNNLFAITFDGSDEYATTIQDVGYILVCDTATASTINVSDLTGYVDGDNISIYNKGEGSISVAGATGVTVIPASLTVAQNDFVQLTFTDSTAKTWLMSTSNKDIPDLANYFNITTDDTDDITEGDNKFVTATDISKLANVPANTNTEIASKQDAFDNYVANFITEGATDADNVILTGLDSAFTSGTGTISGTGAEKVITLSLTHAGGTIYGFPYIYKADGEMLNMQNFSNLTTADNVITVVYEIGDVTIASGSPWIFKFLQF